MVFGRFGVLTVGQARRKARDLLGEVAKDEDPANKRRAKRSGPTINEICDWYLRNAEAGKIIGRSRGPIKASTLQMDHGRIESHIRPLLGKRVIETLKLGDIEAAQADIAAGKTCKPRGGATQGGEGVAACTMSSLHSILEHAVRLSEISNNPCAGRSRLASTPKMRWLSKAELRLMGAAIREAEAEGEHPTGIAALRLLLLTGFRRL